MAIKTKYDIPFDIDENSFSVVVSEPNKSQKQELKVLVDKSKDHYTKRDSLQTELSEAQEEFEINKHILADGKVLEKASVWLEQKALNKQIFKLRKEIDSIDKGLISVNEALEEIYKKRFELLISGADKVSFKKEIEEKGIEYRTIFESIASLIKAAKEKK